ncbi:MAG: ankyrin repeat domain-containing protein [Parachlamydiales bacterium]|jgi:ankyrin repeat protein
MSVSFSNNCQAISVLNPSDMHVSQEPQMQTDVESKDQKIPSVDLDHYNELRDLFFEEHKFLKNNEKGYEGWEVINDCKEFSILLSSTDKKGFNALHHAALYGTPSQIALVNELNPNLIERTTKDGITPFHSALCSGRIEAIEAIYKLNQNLLDATSEDGLTSLHAAIRGKNLEVIKWVYNIRPDLLNIASEKGVIPLHFAARTGDPEIIRYIFTLNPELRHEVTIWGKNVMDFALESEQKDHTSAVATIYELCPDWDVEKWCYHCPCPIKV